MHQSVAPASASRRVAAMASVRDGTSETTRLAGAVTSTVVPRSSAGNGPVVTPAVSVEVGIAATIEIDVAVATDLTVSR